MLSPEKSQLFPFIKMGLENKNDTRMQIYLTEWRETFFRWKIVFCCNEISLKELSKYTYSHLTWENWGKWLQGIKRTFQPARLNCIRQELEHTILGHKKEDNISKYLSTLLPIFFSSLFSLISTLPLCGQWFQWRHRWGGRLLSHRHRHVFGCNCGGLW